MGIEVDCCCVILLEDDIKIFGVYVVELKFYLEVDIKVNFEVVEE